MLKLSTIKYMLDTLATGNPCNTYCFIDKFIHDGFRKWCRGCKYAQGNGCVTSSYGCIK